MSESECYATEAVCGGVYSTPMETQYPMNSNDQPPPLYTYGEAQMYPPPAYMPPVYLPPEAGPDIDPTVGYPPQPPNGGDPDSAPVQASSFSEFDDSTVRRAFIRKVFSIVLLQLLVTFSVVCVFTFSSVVRRVVQRNIWIYVTSYIIFLVVALSLFCCRSQSRKHPWNLMSLTVVTLSMSYMVGTIASFHDTTAVVIAMGSTLVISFTIIVYTSQTRVNVSLCYGILLVLLVDLIMFGIFCTFYYSRVLQIVYGSLGALIFALFLVVDTQLVIGRDLALSPEEYVFAALIIYLDIVMIFIYILAIVGGRR